MRKAPHRGAFWYTKAVMIEPIRHAEVMLQSKGYARVAGVDEVGRGALAGPVVVAAVVLPVGLSLPRVRDSKVLTKLQRRQAANDIRRSGASIGIGWTHSHLVDAYGLTEALRMAALAALAQLPDYDVVLLDGKHNYLDGHAPSHTLIGADASELSVAAASVIAKVARDEWMSRLHAAQPHYGFTTNVGYGSAEHLAALHRHGVSPWHRQSFAPVYKAVRVY